MGTYLRKYLSKYLFFIIIIAILLILVFFYSATSLLNSKKVYIEEILSIYLQKKVAIQSVRYQPLNSIVLDGLTIVKTDATGSEQLMFCKKAMLSFSLIELAKRNLVLTSIYLNNPISKVVDYSYFSKNGLDQFIGIVNSLLINQALDIVIEDAVLPLYEQEELSDYLVVDSKIDIKKKGTILSRGSIVLVLLSEPQHSSENKLDYNFTGNFTRRGVVIDNLELQKENLYLKSWGELEGDFFRLSGSIFSVRPLGTYYLRKPKFLDKIEKFFGRKEKSATQIIIPSMSSLNIFDLGCLVKFIPDGVSIENLSFSLQDMPFRLKGDILFLEPIKLNLQIASFPSQPLPERLQNPRRFDLEIDGTMEDEKFNGRLSLDFLAKIRAKKSHETIEANFRNLSFYPLNNNRLGLNFKEANISCLANNNLYSILLEDLNALVSVADKKSLSIEFLSGLFDGSMKGIGSINFDQIPFKSNFKVSIIDVSANKLSSALAYLSKVYGKLTSEISYRNYSSTNLEGSLSISEGYLDDLKFFGWLSDFFSMPPLKKLNFNKISANFLISDEISSLKDISLESDDINLDGYFNILANDLVSGKLSLVFSEQLLASSAKLTRLLRILKEVSTVNFDFQMSGLYQNMNFKWLASDFKNGLQKLLPAGRERNLEQQIEEAVANITSSME